MAQRTLKQQKEQKQGDLLNSAYQCFLTKGFAKTTIDDIVRRVQVAKGTFYLYFHDKEDIMMEYLSEGNQEEITQILEELLNYPQLRRFDRDEAFRMIYMIVELVGSVCYTSIIEEQPAPIDHLKPTLYRMVEKILI